MQPAQPPRENRIEGRVSSLETSVETLTRDVGVLAASVQHMGENLHRELQSLGDKLGAVGRPDWSVMLTGVMVLLAIGSAAFSPLYLRIGDVQDAMHEQDQIQREHMKLTLHPVGETRIDALERALTTTGERNAQGIRDLDEKLQREATLMEAVVTQKSAELQKQFDEIKAQGSPITRERLALLEAAMKRLERQATPKP